MAHTCPECGQVCYCEGDIDDCVLDTDETAENCTHYKICSKEYAEDELERNYDEDYDQQEWMP